jgi:para-nitrobenzyl esterase
LIAGSTASELRLFLGADFVPPERERLVTRVARYLNVELDEADAIVARYEAEVGADEVWPVLFSDVEMQTPLRKVLDAQAAHAPTYTYLFDWDAPRLGAAHGVDIPFTFGNFGDGWAEFVGYDAAAERVSTELRTAWASFARDGNPGWDPYPVARVFARASSPVVPSHPAFGRLER